MTQFIRSCGGPASVHTAPLVPQGWRPFRPVARPVRSGRAWDSWPLPAEDFSVPYARRLTRTQVRGWGLAEQAETAELLVSELVTNAVRHARGPLRLTIHRREDTLRFEVEDADPARPEMRETGDEDETGRGLQLLELLSGAWGTDHTPTGKVVWFELPT
jgi:hypothetical protein